MHENEYPDDNPMSGDILQPVEENPTPPPMANVVATFTQLGDRIASLEEQLSRALEALAVVQGDKERATLHLNTWRQIAHLALSMERL